MRIVYLTTLALALVGLVVDCERRGVPPSEPEPGASNGGSDGTLAPPASDGSSVGGTVTTGSGGAPSTGGSSGVGGAPAGSGASRGTDARAGKGGEPSVGSPTSDNGSWAPPYRERQTLAVLREGLGVYNPHRPGGATVKGSSHTHAAPDHSGIDAAEQEARLRDLPPPHAQDFVWLTAHNFVAPSPNVPNVLHMFGVEVYVKQASGSAPHMLALLPNGALADEEDTPFGYYSKDISGGAAAIRAAGGLPALAHPMRYAISEAEARALDERLWGIEVMSGSSVVEDNLEFLDEHLSRGKYACLTAGGDIHDEDWSVTRGYLVVSVPKKPASMGEVFEATKACNFFACGAHDEDTTLVEPLALRVEQGRIVVSAPVLATIRFVGKGGNVLKEEKRVMRSEYAPQGDELYVRVEALGPSSRARCYSQPLWLVKT